MVEPNDRSQGNASAADRAHDQMPFLEHIGELRSRLIKCLVAIAALFFVFLYFVQNVIRWLRLPLDQAVPKGVASLHFTGPLDVLFLDIKVAAFAALFVSCPIWLYHLWQFVTPGLYPSERKFVWPSLIVAVVLFLSGIAFCYFLILPSGLKYLIDLGLEVGTPIITVNDYMSLVIMLLMGFGLVFETPVVLILLAAIGLIDGDTLARKRRITIVIIFIVAAIVTPTPDPFTQTAMAVPMYLMFEASIWIIRLMQRNRVRAEASV